MSALQAAAARARAWLTDAALPLWASAGIDADGAFYELLNFDGTPDRASFRRMRVQARQLYVFSEAATRGWLPGSREISDRGFERLLADCWAPDGRPGLIHSLNAGRTPLDAKRDMYDHAFGLFASAWRYKATGDARARDLAAKILAFVDANLADPPNGAFVESIPPALPRRSDPHMHLLEACLEWHSATGEAMFLERAQAMIDLFHRRFFDASNGTLGEFFNADMSLADGPAGQIVTAGHHFEWTWLLDQAAKRGTTPAADAAQTLFDFAQAHGLDAAGFAIDECDRTGRQVRASRRAWPQTEMIKAYVTMDRADDAARAAEAFLDTYLATDVPGLWMDQYDAAGRGITPQVPASTLYHIVVSFRELLLYAERKAA